MNILELGLDILFLGILGIKGCSLEESLLSFAEEVAAYSRLGCEIEFEKACLVVVEVLVSIVVNGVGVACICDGLSRENLLLAEDNLDLLTLCSCDKVEGRLVVSADIGVCKVESG